MDAEFLFSEAGVEFLEANGDEGYVVLIGLLSLLWKSDETKLSKQKISTHSKRLGRNVKVVERIIAYCLENSIFVGDENSFWHEQLLSDRLRLAQKQETYRQNATAKQRLSNGRAIAEQPLSNSSAIAQQWQEQSESNCRANHMNTEYMNIEDPDLGSLDSLTRETCETKLVQAGLEKTDLARALELVARHYNQNPHKKRRGGIIFDVCASWVVQEILNERAAKERLKKAIAPPGSDPESAKRAEVIARMKRNKREETGHEQGTS